MIASLTSIYDEREAAAISSLIMEKLTSMTKTERVIYKTRELDSVRITQFETWLNQLMKHRPVQYVLGEAWFGSLSFFVDEHVLIPRPETQELADWLLTDSGTGSPLSVLDIGTGSGCIPVYLKKKQPSLQITAMDVSPKALDVAEKNAFTNRVSIDFILSDIRKPDQWVQLPETDLIISNPPYIPEKQKTVIEKHVKEFEPDLALFVPDNDPILFYKVILSFATHKLKPGGSLFLEIHHDYAKEIEKWYVEHGFLIELKKDFSGNDRMIKAVKGE